MVKLIGHANGKMEIESDNPLDKEAFEGKSEFSRKLARARLYINNIFELENLTNKELLILSFYVRKIEQEISKSDSNYMEIDREAAYRWLRHITGYNPYDFKGVRYNHFSPEEKIFIEKLRQEFNQNDDTGSFEKS